MTNAEAIETLRANYPDACYEQLREAVDKAIKVMEAQEGDSISRKEAINAIKISRYLVDALDKITKLPSADLSEYSDKLWKAAYERGKTETNSWIPCSEKLPKQGQEVICQCRASIIKVLKLDANGDWYQDADHCYMGGFVIAWMPLPEPYKEGKDAEIH